MEKPDRKSTALASVRSAMAKCFIAAAIPLAALTIFVAVTVGADALGGASELLVTLKSAGPCAERFCGLSIF